jgi:hypothetical protein
MELAWFGYLYTVATLAMTFIGFCAIVLSLHATRDKENRKLKLLRMHTRGYIEIGFSSVVAAMLAPMLAACGLPALLTWRWASAIIAVGLVAHIWYSLKRFAVITEWRIPMLFWVNSTITGLIVLSLIANSSGFMIEPSAGPVVVAATWRLIHAVDVFLLTYEDFFDDGVSPR